MRLDILLCFLFAISTIAPVYSQYSANYLGLKNIQSISQESDNLLFFCRKPNEIYSSKEIALPWQDGILLTTTNDTFAVKTRFISSQDKIEILIDDIPYILFPEKMQALAIGNQVYISSRYPESDQLFMAYFELLSEGKTSLLLKDSHSYYYKIEDQPAQKLKQSKKEVCKIFKNQHKVFKQFIKTNNLNPKKEKDLMSIFSYMNQNTSLR